MRRLAAIAADRGTWVQRAANAETQIASLGERSRFLLLSRTLSSLLRTSDNAKSIDGYTENPPCRMNLLRPCWGTMGAGNFPASNCGDKE